MEKGSGGDDGVDEKVGVDDRLPRSFTLNGALGKFHGGLSARGLGTNPPLNLAHQKIEVKTRTPDTFFCLPYC